MFKPYTLGSMIALLLQMQSSLPPQVGVSSELGVGLEIPKAYTLENQSYYPTYLDVDHHAQGHETRASHLGVKRSNGLCLCHLKSKQAVSALL